MLSRAGSNTSSNKLRHSKSTASVSERRKHPLLHTLPHPETSRLYALIAAHRAMDRSHETSISSASQVDRANFDRYRTPKPRSSIHNSPASATRIQIPNPYIRAARTSARYNVGSDQSCDASTVGTDLGREIHGAEPLPCHQVRSSRSMFIAREFDGRHEGSTSSETALSQAQTLRSAVSCANLHGSSLRVRLRRSLKLLRPLTRAKVESAQLQPEITCRPESVVLARSQFLQGTGQLQETGNVLQSLHSRAKKEQKAFRTSLRTPFTHDDNIDAEALPEPVPSLAKKKRSLSTTLRSRFVKTFTKRRHDSVAIPPQQVTATRDHLSTSSTNTGAETGFDSYHDTDTSSMKRNSIYMPSAQHPETCDDADDLSERLIASTSFESLRSTSRSRVTSWTNSTATASVRGAPYEKNRLSIIKEDGGPHQPSSSVGRHIGGVSAFQQPMTLQDSNPVDSQRIYSALRKRIDQEDDEMLATQAALEKIHEAEEHADSDCCPPKYINNIRLVQSQSSLPLTDNIDCADQSGQGLVTSEVEEANFDEQKDQKQIFLSKKRSSRQDVPSSFFPFSLENKPLHVSPFKQLLIAKRQKQGTPISYDGISDNQGTLNHKPRNSDAGTGKFGQSSDSIYSRTTDGGPNLHYVPPIGSVESFEPKSLDTGMATIMYSSYGISNGVCDPTTRIPTGISATASEKSAWRGWVETQMASFARHGSKASTHIREHAKIVPEEPEPAQCSLPWCEEGRIGQNGRVPLSDATRMSSTTSDAGREHVQTPSDLYDMCSTKPNNSTIEDATRCPQHPSLLGINIQGPCDAHSEILGLGTLRKLSPGSIMRTLKEKKSEPLLSSSSDHGKENKPSTNGNSTPVSTPGRLHLQTMSVNDMRQSRGRTYKSVVGDTRRQNASVENESPTTARESPSDNFRATLSARLSRPFDMDVPQPNRPFDSMYLGKRESGHPEAIRGGRLSVAHNTRQLRPFKSYGGLGLMSVDSRELKVDRECTEDTALPRIPDQYNSEDRSTSFSSLATSGKRMVSQFLRTRRKIDQLGEQDSDLASNSSHAFI